MVIRARQARSTRRRLEAIHQALAADRSPEEATALILREATRLARAPRPAGLYWAGDGAGLAPSPALSRLPPALIDALRAALAHGRPHACLLAEGLAPPSAALALLPVWVDDELAAILLVPLPRPRLSPVRAAGLRRLAGLLAVALSLAQQPAPPVPAQDDEALRRIVAGVAHELNNPLAIISGYAQMLKGAGAPPELQPDLERIDHAARRAAQVVRDLLAFARQQPMAPTHSDLSGLIADALAAEQPALDEAGITVTVEAPQGLPTIYGDRLQLTQVLVNLVAQARRAIAARPGAGRLTISAAAGQRLRLSIADDGEGLPQEQLSRVFEPFLVAQEGGLALAVCRSLVHAHGGRIWATNNPQGGTTFHIELPATG